jgi:hypothetical protein
MVESRPSRIRRGVRKLAEWSLGEASEEERAAGFSASKAALRAQAKFEKEQKRKASYLKRCAALEKAREARRRKILERAAAAEEEKLRVAEDAAAVARGEATAARMEAIRGRDDIGDESEGEVIARAAAASGSTFDLLTDVMWVYEWMDAEKLPARRRCRRSALGLLRWVQESARNKAKFIEVLLPKAWSEQQKKDVVNEERGSYFKREAEIAAILDRYRSTPAEGEWLDDLINESVGEVLE